jgi:subtilisin family serine protease
MSCAGISDDAAPGTGDSPGAPGAPVSPGQPTGTGTAAVTKADPYKPGELIVRFKAGVTHNRSAAVHAKYATQVVREYRIPSNLQLVKVPQGMTVENAIADYQRDPDVLYAEPNFLYYKATVPNDSRFGELWGMNNSGQSGGVADADINAAEAWDITTGSNSVFIGSIDTGFDYTHPDLIANIWVNPGEIPGNGIDDDGDGYIDDIHGIDATTDSGDPFDVDGHGTHTTGTIAARGNNGAGVAGVNWNATVISCKAFNPSATLDDLLQCMDYFLMLKTRAVNPVDIVATNNSWGGGAFAQSLLDAIEAHNQAGMLFIAAAGNNGANNDVTPFYPATYDADNIISVLAYNRSNQRSSFSNFGALSVDVGAPGEDVLSTLPGNSYGLLSGTSMATPHVTGLVGLLKAQDPNRTARQIKNLILTGAVSSPATLGNVLTGGRIRADNSLTCVNRTLANRVAPTTASVITGTGTQIPLAYLSITCDAATTTPLAVTVAETGETIPLIDATGGGLFAATFTPTRIGTSTLTFPNGDVVSISAVGNYDPARVVPFAFETITGMVLPLICDDCSATLTSPFPIRFAGSDPGFTTVNVGSNGVLSFSGPITAFSNTPLPTTVAATLVAPFWDDMLPAAGSSIKFDVLGTAPARKLVIEYRDVPHFSGIGAATFQVVFFENSPNIQFNYLDVVFENTSFDDGVSATVGVQVTSGVAQQFSFNTPSLSNSLSLLFSMGAPQASAGPDQVVLPGASVTLDGSASADFDGTVVSFAWTQTAGTPVVLTGADTATPSFTAPDPSGTLTFQLTVTDNDGNTGSDTVNVIVNRPPVAVPNADFRVGTGLTGTLDGTASFDPDGVVVGFHWTQLHGDPVTIMGADTPIATFIAPATAQFLVFQLTVVDEHGFTGTAVVVADVFLNIGPIAEAGQNRIVRPGATVTLDGSASHDPDGAIASFAWTAPTCVTVLGPCSVVLIGADTATPSFVAPPAFGFVVLHLVVTDSAGATASDDITIGVFLQAPTAVIAAPAVCAIGGSTITLDGSRSSDPDGQIVGYAWTQVSGPPVTLMNATSPVASFVAPTAGTVVFALTVTDSDDLTATTQTSFTIDTPPAADAEISAPAATSGTVVTLSGTQSTGAVGFAWRQTAGQAVAITNANTATATFVAPRLSVPFMVLTFELTVTDACGATSTDTVSIVAVSH